MLPVESMNRLHKVLLQHIDDRISIALDGCSKDDQLVCLLHAFQKLYHSRSHRDENWLATLPDLKALHSGLRSVLRGMN